MPPESLSRVRTAALQRVSRSLTATLDADPKAVALLASEAELPDRVGYTAVLLAALEVAGPDELIRERRRRLAEIAARDVTAEIDLERATEALADLADACLQVALRAVGAPDDLAVIGMGKLGGRELNYASDIDIVFVAADDPAAATPAAEALLHLVGRHMPEGPSYRVDLELRPEGRSGPLVRSLESCLEYYRRWAEVWEFQALIKARLCAGDATTGAALVTETRPLVYPAEISGDRVAAIRKMKERVEDHATRRARRKGATETADVKLGPGGIRDIEFAVQLLQMVHGGTDESVRRGNTLKALGALVVRAYVAEDDGAGLDVAYRWLRTVEHRLQLWQERQTHRLPSGPQDMMRLARALGCRGSPAASAAQVFEQRHRAILSDVRGRFEKLFYRPMIESLTATGAHQMSGEALKHRLRVLGYRDVERATRTLTGLVTGPTRRARLVRVLAPALLRRLASAPAPDDGLVSFLRLCESFEGRADILGAFRDNPAGLELLGNVLGSGRVVGELLQHVPEELMSIADPRGPRPPRDREASIREAIASLEWRAPEDRLDGLRRFKRRSLVGIALNDLAGRIDTAGVGVGLSDVADACLQAALEGVELSFAVIGVGRLGGRELSYSSDIDVMFVHDGDHAEAERVAERLVRAIGAVTPEGKAFRIDAALRPEGKSGPLVRSLASYRQYYERWAEPWERLALLRARPAAGDAGLGERFESIARPFAYPAEITPAILAEIRHLKARMERERIPRGTDPKRHFKLGPGGASDVEFAVQMMQLQFGAVHPGLRSPQVTRALEVAAEEDLITSEDAAVLRDAHRFYARLRNRLFLLTGKPGDVLPARPEDLEALGIAMDFRRQPRQELEESYLRTTRRVRRVAEPLIYG